MKARCAPSRPCRDARVCGYAKKACGGIPKKQNLVPKSCNPRRYSPCPKRRRFSSIPEVIFQHGPVRNRSTAELESGLKGAYFCQSGGYRRRLGVLNKFNRTAGPYPPPVVVRRGASCSPLCATVPSNPISDRETKRKTKGVCVRFNELWGLASPSELNLRQVGARAGTSRGCVFPTPNLAEAGGGIPPFNHFA